MERVGVLPFTYGSADAEDLREDIRDRLRAAQHGAGAR
jgi:hypothetical protein